MLSLLVSLSLLSVGVYCYPNGAPTGSCGSMIPGHNAAVQTGASPYRVTMNTTSYDAGDVIEGTLIYIFSYQDMHSHCLNTHFMKIVYIH